MRAQASPLTPYVIYPMPNFQYHGGSLWFSCQHCAKQFTDRGFDFDNILCEDCESLEALVCEASKLPQEVIEEENIYLSKIYA